MVETSSPGLDLVPRAQAIFHPQGSSVRGGTLRGVWVTKALPLGRALSQRGLLDTDECPCLPPVLPFLPLLLPPFSLPQSSSLLSPLPSFTEGNSRKGCCVWQVFSTLAFPDSRAERHKPWFSITHLCPAFCFINIK